MWKGNLPAAALAAVLLAMPAPAVADGPGAARAAIGTLTAAGRIARIAVREPRSLDQFLDRLMLAESGGSDLAKNPLSTALGAFQFIESTFLEVARRNFADEVDALSEAEILALRTDRAFARRVAAAYSEENAAELAGAGVAPTFVNLRLAFLVGPSGAIGVLKAPKDTALAEILEPAALRANPFMATMTSDDLVRRARADISFDALLKVNARSRSKSSLGGIRVRCNLGRPSCRKWVALQKRKLRAKQ
jgi:hypothetical protein